MTSPVYYAYLLRMWCGADPDQRQWFASLEDPHTHQVIGFNTLEQLVEYLQKKTWDQPENGTKKMPGAVG